LLQVSRFDPSKDPLGVIEVYRILKERMDCQLVLAGGGAEDDPEGSKILAKVMEETRDDPHIHILDLPPTSFLEINALQRGADVIIQKSLKEGFGLTVTEALWKEKAVVGGKVGGIKLQIRDGENGFLVSSVGEAAQRVEYLFKNPSQAQKMGKAGKKLVREKFLIARHLKDYLNLVSEITSS
ncbi:glycosyltransferase, partial [Candidatus Aerophobetes bacterium]